MDEFNKTASRKHVCWTCGVSVYELREQIAKEIEAQVIINDNAVGMRMESARIARGKL